MIPDAFEPFIRRVEHAIDHHLRSLDPGPALLDAARYAVLGGGKRVRPILTLLSCRAVGGADDLALPPACAVELVHAFSLVHDDLPALDNDTLRRGRPTLHVHAGEPMAILAGDLLLAAAFSLIADRVPDRDTASRLTAQLARATTDMIAGQVYDTLGGLDHLPDHQRLDRIHSLKTGALITAACRMGAIAAGADDHALEPLSRYAADIGLMFQIVDDLLDVQQTPDHVGKRTRKDADAGKRTAPAVLGVDGARRRVEQLAHSAVQHAQRLGPPAAPLVDLASFLRDRTR